MARKKKQAVVEEVVVETPVEVPVVVAPVEEKKPRKKKEELKASDITSVTPAGIPSLQKAPPVPLDKRKIVPHLLVQEVQSLRNDVDSLKVQIAGYSKSSTIYSM